MSCAGRTNATHDTFARLEPEGRDGEETWTKVGRRAQDLLGGRLVLGGCSGSRLEHKADFRGNACASRLHLLSRGDESRAFGQR